MTCRRSTTSRAALERALPESGPPAIVHGDYRLDNTMLAHDDPAKIVAVLDWEMSTLGDPLTDLGAASSSTGAATRARRSGRAPGSMAAEGFIYQRRDRRSATPQQSGRSVEHLDFYVVFATYKLAVILEGINARFLMGKTLGEGFGEMGELVVAAREERPRRRRRGPRLEAPRLSVSPCP